MSDGARDALVDRLFHATIGALELLSVHVGRRLGLYEALASGPATPAELAARAGIDERYAREWLEQQAVAGFVEVDEPGAAADQRRFTLPAGHGEVLVDAESPAYVAPFAALVAGIAQVVSEVVDAYRSGAGVAYARYGADFRDGQGAINRPAFVHELARWFASVPAIEARLRSSPPARVADLGCGQGWSSLAIARAYPEAIVEGVDLDEASIADARQRLHDDPSVAGRLSFTVKGGAELASSGPYDLVCIFEALHDMAAPVDALVAARKALGPDGHVLVVDERVADAFTAPGDEVERMMYGWSVLHCLPASRAEQPSAALGTALRAGTVVELAQTAGFRSTEVLPIENDFFRFYLLSP